MFCTLRRQLRMLAQDFAQPVASQDGQLQVPIGRGELDYSKIVAALNRFHYRGAMVVAMDDQPPQPDFDVEAEVRKLGRVLESLL